MHKLAETIKNMAESGQIDTKRLIQIAQQQDDIIRDVKPVLERCATQVGVILGEEIEAITSRMDGRRFNAASYHYEKPIDGQ